MDWTDGYTATYLVHRVNPKTWENAELVANVDSMQVERDGTGEAPMLESGRAAITVPAGESFAPGYYRFTMRAEQNVIEDVDIATLYCHSAGGTTNYGVTDLDIEGESVLKPAADRLLTSGSYAPRGADGARFAADLLGECLHAPIDVGASFALAQHVVFDIGDSYLEAVWSLLKAGGCIMQIDGDGTVSIVKRPTEPSLVLDSSTASMLMPEIQPSVDYDGIPNRYTAIDEFESVTVVNDDPNSITSTVSRGYVKDEVDDSPTRVDGETLTAYARRMLQEKSTVDDERVYDREYYPNVHPFSIVRGNLPSIGFDGDMVVRSQSLKIEHGIVVTEKAAHEITTWEA